MGSTESGRRREKDPTEVLGEGGVYSIKEENSWAGDTALMTHYRLDNKFGTCENVSLERLEWDDIFADDWEIVIETLIVRKENTNEA